MKLESREAEIGRLVSLHKAVSSQREKAVFEEQMWWLSSPEERRTTNRLKWLSHKVGDSQGICEARSKLREAPPEMWDYIAEHGVSLGMAVRIYSDSLHLMKAEGLSFKGALVVASKPRASLKPAGRKSGKVGGASREGPSKGDWAKLYSVVDDIAQARMLELSEFDRRDLCEDLKRRIQANVKLFCGKVQRKRAGETQVSLVRLYQQVRQACTALQIDLPEYRKLVDLKAAKRKKLALVALHHPDSNSAGDTDAYQAVIEAYDVLDSYNALLVKLTNGRHMGV